MGRTEDLVKLDRAVKDGEIRLKTVKTNLDALEKEIKTLSILQVQLEENVKCLKQKNIIAIAAEFKKAKEDLIKTKTKLIQAKISNESYKKAYSEVEFVLNKSKTDYEKLQKIGDNNVLHPKFRRKNGQK